MDLVDGDRKRLIVNGNLLTAEMITDRLVGRKSEFARLQTCLAPLLSGQLPLNVWLFGPSGSGKTTLAQQAVQDTCDARSRIGVNVNCWQHRSLHGVLLAIVEELKIARAEDQDTGVKLSRIREVFRGRPAVIVLDDIDRPMPAQRQDIIYGLLTLPKVGLICIANSTVALATLDESVRSRLSPVIIELKGHSSGALETILADRARQALAPGTWTDAVLRRIAEVANGDARLAVQILRQTAVTAEDARCVRIGSRFVEHFARQRQALQRERRLAGLSEHERVIHALVRKHAPLRTTELARLYVEYCQGHGVQPMAGRTFRKYLSRLASAGILAVSQAPTSSRGRLVSLNATR
jgi:cell division control protein 6